MSSEDASMFKIIDIGVPMKLYKMINGETTDKIWLINKFDLYLTSTGKAQNSCITYRKSIKTMLRSAHLDKPTLTSIEIEKYLSKKTAVHFAAVKSFIRFIRYEFNKKFLDIDFPRPKKPKDKPKIEILTPMEVEEVIKFLPSKYHFFTRFLFAAALRISEMYRLKVESVNWDFWMKDKTKYGLLVVRKTKGRRDREVPLHPDFMLKLFDYVEKRDGEVDVDKYLFDYDIEHYFKKRMRRMKKDNVGIFLDLDEKGLYRYREDAIWHKFISKEARLFEIEFRKASMKALGRFANPHQLRRGRATQLLKAGMPIMQLRDLLGHVSITTTQNYLKTGTEELKYTMESIQL